MTEQSMFVPGKGRGATTGFSLVHFQQGFGVLLGSPILISFKFFALCTCYPIFSVVLSAGKDFGVSYSFSYTNQPTKFVLVHMFASVSDR